MDRTSAKRTRGRAAVRVARKLVNEIRRRGLRPGMKLDAEHRMVEELGVARGTVREALRFLELQGGLRIKAGPGGGPVVSVPGADHLASVLSLHLQFAGASFRSVLDARRSIYPLLASQAAENASRQDIAALHECVAKMKAAEDTDVFQTEARRFFSLVAAAANNPVLALLVDALHRMSEGSQLVWDEKQRRSAARTHGKVVEAIESGDPDAAGAIMEKSLAAAMRTWQRVAPEQLEQAVAWIDVDQEK